ncbi:hypothetical protein BDP27DRAFT_1323894 [Rhodocollybia butyracea]|uniref:Uncharacterized protein n=1 Tax=Rhodocollybia butyracea TaxID=206335 RepID=A0A9P5U8Y1_9AGAR|nr:hypothetical protein BDP27DRAFT_1323894 [Rhodocollybia butyracea]
MALEKGTMFVLGERGDIKEVPIPITVKESGDVPSGYSVDFVLSPERVIAVLNSAGVRTISQLPEDTHNEMRGIINNPANLSIVPTGIHETKRATEAQTDAKLANDEKD